MLINLTYSLIFGLTYSHCYVLKTIEKGGGTDFQSYSEDGISDDGNQMFKDISVKQLAEDDHLIKGRVMDATGARKLPEELVKEVEAIFLSTILRLVGNGELYKDARIEAIEKAMESAFLVTTGKVNHEYIDGVMEAVKNNEKKKEMKSKEHEENVLSPSKIVDDFLDGPVIIGRENITVAPADYEVSTTKRWAEIGHGLGRTLGYEAVN